MTTLKPPPVYVNLPPAIVYDKQIPDGIARTWMQIYGLYWNKDNEPQITFENLMAITGKSRASLFGHLSVLRNSGWLLFSTAQDGSLRFDFTKALQSKLLDLQLLIKDPFNSIDSNQEELKRGESKKLDLKRDPLLDNDAVKLYRTITHLTANIIQRQQLAEKIKDISLWKATLEHWMMHGWSPTNVGGMIDSYRQGGKAACNYCNRKSQKSIVQQNLDNIRASLEKHNVNP